MEIKYVAFDGCEFTSEKECETYEQVERGKINDEFSQVKRQITYDAVDIEKLSFFACEDEVYAVLVETQMDLEIINKWIKSHDSKNPVLAADTVGTVQLFELYNDHNICLMGTPEEFISYLASGVQMLFNNLTNIEIGVE